MTYLRPKMTKKGKEIPLIRIFQMSGEAYKYDTVTSSGKRDLGKLALKSVVL